ncbi:MAG: hypothetical protein WAX85_01560 [Minisyncoccia bacterium]
MLDSMYRSGREEGQPFDVLDSQRDPNHRGGGATRIKIRFEKLRKPTELEPLYEEKIKDKKPVETIITALKKAREEEPERFKAPRVLVSHINKLVLGGRKLKALAFDIEEATSTDEIRKILNSKFEKDLITKNERDEMLTLLDDSRTGDQKEETVTPEKLQEEVTTVQPEIIENIPEEGHPLQIKRKKIDMLKNSYGIVIEHVGGTHSQLEQRIIDKSNALWKGNDRDVTVASFLMSGEVQNFEKQPEIKPVFEQSVDIPVVNTTEQEVKDGPEIKQETSELSTGAIEVKKEDKTEKASTREEETSPVEFEGKNVQIVRRGKNSIKVLFDGKEIAIGLITSKGPSIKIKNEFKAGWLFAPTDAERAFQKALKLIKTFKIN